MTTPHVHTGLDFGISSHPMAPSRGLLSGAYMSADAPARFFFSIVYAFPHFLTRFPFFHDFLIFSVLFFIFNVFYNLDLLS